MAQGFGSSPLWGSDATHQTTLSVDGLSAVQLSSDAVSEAAVTMLTIGKTARVVFPGNQGKGDTFQGSVADASGALAALTAEAQKHGYDSAFAELSDTPSPFMLWR